MSSRGVTVGESVGDAIGPGLGGGTQVTDNG